AHYIHARSGRAGAPFLGVNCATFNVELLASELFGHVRGAFTGAVSDRRGLFDQADGGTLFLDEVAEMPRALQAILLRFLEDGTFYRVGDNHPRHADVRLICATCRDLPGLVEEGRFRQDLYYRIKGACLTLPSLRIRRDLDALSRFLLTGVAPSASELPSLSDEARDWILRHPWPGNVRELKNALRHAVALADDEIRLEHLPVEDPRPALRRKEAAPPASSRRPKEAEATDGPTLKEAEGAALKAALEAADGNLSGAARTLGIARSTLYRLMERHGLRQGG
ncbi:MAG: sigma 54-interacting transcriptional regulator, partial [Acidobacteria bacterium]|nr:sigma 54-interacting transcriptional regulator [Acidobacteriota bacterium]